MGHIWKRVPASISALLLGIGYLCLAVAQDAVPPFHPAGELPVPNPTSDGRFGAMVAMDGSGDLIVVSKTGGCPTARVPSQSSLLTYSKSGETWKLEQCMMASGGAYALAGGAQGTLMLQGPDLYAWNGSGWELKTHLDLPRDATDASAFSVGGDTIVYGAKESVLVYSGPTQWHQERLASPSKGPTIKAAHGSTFGQVVAVSGDGATLAVTAASELQDGPNIKCGPLCADHMPVPGVVYIFARNGTSWTQKARLIPETDGFPNPFGSVLALNHDGSELIVGVADEVVARKGQMDFDDVPDGAAYVFRQHDGKWSQEARLEHPHQPYTGSARFGCSVAMDATGDRAVIAEEGEAHVFERGAQGRWISRQVIRKPAKKSDNGQFANRLALSGSGGVLVISDAAAEVNAPGSVGRLQRAGAVWVYEATETASR